MISLKIETNIPFRYEIILSLTIIQGVRVEKYWRIHPLTSTSAVLSPEALKVETERREAGNGETNFARKAESNSAISLCAA